MLIVNAIKNHLNIEPIQEQLTDTKEVVVFGYGRCLYVAVGAFFGKKFKNPHGGLHSDDGKYRLGSRDEQVFESLAYEQQIRRIFKMIPTNLVLENYKRSQLSAMTLPGEPLMKMVYCLDRDNNPYPFDEAKVAETSPHDEISNSELRRIRKLQRFPGLEQVAKDSFIFVIMTMIDGRPTLKPVPAPWERPRWEPAYQARMERSRLKGPKVTPVEYQWKVQLRKAMDRFDERLALNPDAAGRVEHPVITRSLVIHAIAIGVLAIIVMGSISFFARHMR